MAACQASFSPDCSAVYGGTPIQGFVDEGANDYFDALCVLFGYSSFSALEDTNSCGCISGDAVACPGRPWETVAIGVASQIGTTPQTSCGEWRSCLEGLPGSSAYPEAVRWPYVRCSV